MESLEFVENMELAGVLEAEGLRPKVGLGIGDLMIWKMAITQSTLRRYGVERFESFKVGRLKSGKVVGFSLGERYLLRQVKVYGDF